MTLLFDAAEISRAIQTYAASRVYGAVADDFSVTVHWRSRTATIERKRPIPTLTDQVKEEA